MILIKNNLTPTYPKDYWFTDIDGTLQGHFVDTFSDGTIREIGYFKDYIRIRKNYKEKKFSYCL